MLSKRFSAGILLALTAASQSMLAQAPARNAPVHPQASDPGAAVPVLLYQSVLQGGSKGVVSDRADWKKSNDEVGQFRRGHADVLKWEERAAPAQNSQPAPANPAMAPKP